MMPGDLDAILDTADTIQKNLHARGARDIPSTPGFCLNEGFIVGGGLDTEMFQVNILLADMPGVYLLFESSTRIKTITLLDELQDFLQSKPAQAAAVEVLHQGNQAAGGIQGQEYLIVSARGSMRKYAYTWATQGRQNSAQEPSLVLELFMTEHAGAKPADDDTSSALSPDMRAALNRMNAILATLRLHPGAAAIEVPAHSPGVNPPH
ncbi:MAG: T6SS immunity protein Tli4 family protein [Corticimicrobacter sp.]|uniref:T6SS immunity protein Tli4 family protein n=1 Tax=Corticimicrobacter sp. TaxID=2678536 RepID=UPI0032DA0836